MVKIVYKEGCKGLNRLDCIEGISIDLFTGKRALIYPKYSEQIMLSEDKIEQCELRSRTEIEALKLIENRFATDALAAFDSPAAAQGCSGSIRKSLTQPIWTSERNPLHSATEGQPRSNRMSSRIAGTLHSRTTPSI